MPLRFSHVQSSWLWSIYSFNWGRLHLKHWEKGGSIQILPFSGQFSNGTRLMPCFLSISHRRREVWQRMRCIPAGSCNIPARRAEAQRVSQREKPQNECRASPFALVGSPSPYVCQPGHQTGTCRVHCLFAPPAEDDAGSTVPAQGRRGGRLPETSGDQVKQLRRRRSRLRK